MMSISEKTSNGGFMQKAAQFLESLDKILQKFLTDRRFTPKIAAVAASIVSGTTTFIGLHTLLTESLMAGPTAHLISAVVTFVVQIALLWTIFSFFHDKGGALKRSIWLFGYAVAVAISVGLGYAYYWSLIRAEDYARQELLAQVHVIEQNSTSVQALYQGLADRLNHLEVYSENMAKRERTEGGTCDENRQAQDGPRRRLRSRDARQISYYVDRFENKHEPVKATTRGLGQATSALRSSARYSFEEYSNVVERLHALNRKLSLASRDNTLTELKTWAQNRIQDGRETLRDPQTGKEFECPDEILEDHLSKIVNAPEVKLTRVSQSMPRPADAGWRTLEAFHVLSAILRPTIKSVTPDLDVTFNPRRAINERRQQVAKYTRGTSEPTEVPRLLSNDGAPLFLGLLVDFWIFYLAARSGGAGSGRFNISLLQQIENEEPRLSNDMMTVCVRTIGVPESILARHPENAALVMYKHLSSMALFDGKNYYILYPVVKHSSSRVTARLSKGLISLLVELKAIKLRYASVKRVPRILRDLIEELPLREGAYTFHIYEIDGKFMSELLLEALRRGKLAGDSGFEPDPRRDAESAAIALDKQIAA